MDSLEPQRTEHKSTRINPILMTKNSLLLVGQKSRLSKWQASKVVFNLMSITLCWCFLLKSEAFLIAPQIQRTTSNPSLYPSNSALMGIKGFRFWFEKEFPVAVTGKSKSGVSEQFDHVLIDVNQLLHACLRRGRTEEHALGLLMKQLDSCTHTATPIQSLVLAMDGPPSAAKLATQRRRRLQVLRRSEKRLSQLQRFSKSMSQKKREIFRRKCKIEVNTLKITPGTEFMKKAKQCLLYWAWQRLQNPKHLLSHVNIYISSSDAPGEGEIKLLDWIIHHRPKGSIAIMSGDADMVLEGLVIPPGITHDVFVLLPQERKRMLVISLWETTRTMSRRLPNLDPRDIMRVRSDMVILLILNGNDYLPKLHGSSGFAKVFKVYINTLKQWILDKKPKPFLVDPESLQFSLNFCSAFFSQLQSLHSVLTNEDISGVKDHGQTSYVGHLHNLIDSPFLPKTLLWQTISRDCDGFDVTDEEIFGDEDRFDSDDEEFESENLDYGDIDDDNDDDINDDDDIEDDINNDDDIEDDINDDDDIEDDIEDHYSNSAAKRTQKGKSKAKMRLTIGKKGGNGKFYSYETRMRGNSKETKNFLAKMAIDDILGEDFLKEAAGDNSRYEWELPFPTDSHVEAYLGGLLWNLQTYQDGICSDYGYNYGRRIAPSPEEISQYFEKAIADGRVVGKTELIGDQFGKPVSAGISCLAALPSKVQELIPEPYCWIPNDVVEKIYGSCMNPTTNEFDLIKFGELCDSEVERMRKNEKDSTSCEGKNSTNKPFDQNHRTWSSENDHWIKLKRASRVIVPPYAPPEAFSEVLSSLRPNKRITVRSFNSTVAPRSRSSEGPFRVGSTLQNKKGRGHDRLLDLGSLLEQGIGKPSISKVRYFMPYVKKKKRITRSIRTQDIAPTKQIESRETGRKRNQSRAKELQNQTSDFGMENIGKIKTNTEGQTALTILKQCIDANLVQLEWNSIIPSPSQFATVDPDRFELVQLKVCGGNNIQPRTTYFSGELDREIYSVSKQVLRQHLASLALSELLKNSSITWYGTGFEEVKVGLMRIVK